MTRDLYLPHKYKVWTGGGSVGFCTVWSDPELILQIAPGILKKVGILGTLYSREGVNILLRNLALNPDITQLFIWGYGPLSQTPFGLSGVTVLKSLWAKRFGADYKVTGTTFKLHSEFSLEVISQVIKNVELVDVSKMKIKDVVGKISTIKKGEYMKPARFSDHKLEEGRVFPSEKVGFVCRGEKIADAWIRVTDKIMRYGTIKETEYGNKQRELINVNWVVENEETEKPNIPPWPEEVTKVNGANPKFLKKYYPEFMSAKLPAGTVYTYGQRLWNYKNRYNQIEKIIEHIKESAVTRRAVATTWDQFVDSDKKTKNPPCLVSIQAIQSDEKLHLLAAFRSHDIFKAAVPNAFGLRKLQEYIAKKTGFKVGCLSIISASAHIYEEDWDNALKLMRCSLWEREPKMVFDEKLDADPRGNIIIRIENEKIVADLVSGGTILLTIEGKSARAVYQEIANLDPLSRPDHYMSIAAELQKAEIAIELKIKYKQDRPLLFSKNHKGNG